MTVTVDRSVEDFVATPRQLFIDGQWTDAASGQTFETPNPATGETLASVAEGDAEDINRAVRAARRAFEDGPWSRMTPSDRGRLIWKIGDLILEHADELAQLESLDNGKPVGVARPTRSSSTTASAASPARACSSRKTGSTKWSTA
jgi:phenylacetaldehyde dehydrogenase